MKLLSEIKAEYEDIKELLDNDDNSHIDNKLTCCERARFEGWAEALSFCMYAEGEMP